MSALYALLAVVSVIAAGDLLARFVCATGRDARLARVGFACVLGPGVVAYCLFVLGLVGLPLGATTCRILAGAVIVAAVGLRRRAPTNAGAVNASGATVGSTMAWVVAIVPLACLALGFVFVLVAPPANDAFSNWGLKSLALWRDASLGTPDLREDGRFLFHPNYPLLVPLVQAFVHSVAGEPAERAARALFLFAQAGAGLVLCCGLSRFVRPSLAALAGAVLCATPHFWRSGETLRFAGSIPAGYADPMFTALVAATLAAALLLVRRTPGTGPRDGILLGICAGLAVFTKNEGVPLLISVAIGALFAAAVSRSRATARAFIVPIGVASLTAAALAAPWFVFRAQLPARDENYHALLALGTMAEGAWRIPIIAVSALSEALAVDRHGLVWIALCIALGLRLRRLLEPSITFALACLVAMAAAYAIVFVVTPLPIVDSLATSIPRTFFHMTPVAIALVALLVGPRREDATR